MYETIRIYKTGSCGIAVNARISTGENTQVILQGWDSTSESLAKQKLITRLEKLQTDAQAIINKLKGV